VSAAAALARAEAAGVRLRLHPDGLMRMEAASPPPAAVLAELRQHREGVAALLAARAQPATPTPDAEHATIMAEPELPPAGSPERERQDRRHRATLAGLLASGLQRPPAWSDPASEPPPGAWCGCCGRFSRIGGRWWREAEAPLGWRCWTCHPPDGRPMTAVVEVWT
jgi:hypothetical protein